MTIQNLTGFETGNAEEHYSTSGTVDLAYTADKKSGVSCLRVNPTGTNIGWVNLLPTVNGSMYTTNSGPAENYIQFHFKALSLPASSEEEFFEHKDCIFLRVTSDGTLKIFNGSGTTQPTSGHTSSAGVIVEGTWHHIELYVSSAYAAGSDIAWVKVDGVTVISTTTGDFGGSSTDFLYFGKSNNRNGQSVDFLYDNAIWSSTQLSTEAQILLSMATSGTPKYSGFTTTNGFGDYRDVDEIPWTTADYVRSGSAGAKHTFPIQSCATVGISGTILVVCPIVLRSGTSTQALIWVDAGDTDRGQTPVSQGAAASAIKLFYETNPVDSGAWETADIDPIQVGGEDASTYMQLHAVGAYVVFVPSEAQIVTLQQRDYAPDNWQLFHNPR